MQQFQEVIKKPKVTKKMQPIDSEKKKAPPKNGYSIFVNKERPKIAAANKGMNYMEINKICGQQWKALTEVEKNVYREEAHKLNMEAARDVVETVDETVAAAVETTVENVETVETLAETVEITVQTVNTPAEDNTTADENTTAEENISAEDDTTFDANTEEPEESEERTRKRVRTDNEILLLDDDLEEFEDPVKKRGRIEPEPAKVYTNYFQFNLISHSKLSTFSIQYLIQNFQHFHFAGIGESRPADSGLIVSLL